MNKILEIFLITFYLSIIDNTLSFKTNLNDVDKQSQLFQPLNEFSTYSLIKPQIFNTRRKRAAKDNLEESSNLNEFQFKYRIEEENIEAKLHLMDDLLPSEHFIQIQNPNGKEEEFSVKDGNFCNYQGTIEGKVDSKIAISTCSGGMNGVIFDGNQTYFIHSEPDAKISDQHYLFKSSDLIQKGKCGVDTSGTSDQHVNHRRHHHDEFARIFRHKRSFETIKGPFNANHQSSYVEFVLVIDNSVYNAFNKNVNDIHNYCKNLVNIINALYLPLNVFVALTGVVIWTEKDEILVSRDSESTLKNFMEYRSTKLSRLHPHDNAYLLTNVKFANNVVGKAYVATMCSKSSSGGVAVRHSSVISAVASTIAHEMGHNFGMKHDEDLTFCRCHIKNCIMAETTSSAPIHHWSSCSIQQINNFLSNSAHQCLRNKPKKLFKSSTCGNGFVEPGEECDCGLPEYCDSNCCNPHTCQLRTNATCATGECCDISTCDLKLLGVPCRESSSECDLPEYCSGKKEYCPTDVFKQDATSCDNGNGYCFEGLCGSRNEQCMSLYGSNALSEESCYEQNVRGNMHGHCGYDSYSNNYKRCHETDIKCGALQCSNKYATRTRLDLNAEKYSLSSTKIFSSYKRNTEGFLRLCQVTEIYPGDGSPDLGMTPNGAKCGSNGMCVNQKCIEIEETFQPNCADNCNGNGVCNSRGNCHCFEGYAPPFCIDSGDGGSVDSGLDINEIYSSQMSNVYIAVSTIICLALAASLLIYLYKKRKSNQLLRKSSRVYAETTLPIVPVRKSQIGGITLVSTTNPKILTNSTELIINDDDDNEN